MAARGMLVAGRYRLREPVGSGGMGRVWLARDETLDRDVAVKEFVPPDWMTDDEKSRLKDRTLREARSAARLNHAHVVQIYDVVHAQGQPWIVMEYVPSRSLHQVIHEDGPFSPAAAARIGLDVLAALTAAHRAGVLHRDIKPHNVLIGAGGRVVLTDFGLATFVDDGSVTGPGLVVGSPQYVSPERARDGASTVESDLWSFGATLYAAVEGRSPYARESAMATLMSLATEPPDPPLKAGPLGPVLIGLLRHDPAARLDAVEVDRQMRMIVAAAGAGEVVSSPSVPAPRPRPRPSAAVDRVEAPEPTPNVPALRRGNQVLMRALPVQRESAGLISPSPISPHGSLPHQPISPAPASVEPRRRARSTMAVAAITLIALLGGGSVLTGYLIQHNDDGTSATAPAVAGLSPSPTSATSPSSSGPGGFSPVVCNGRAPSAAPTTPQKGAARGVSGWALLDGWSYFTVGTGFHMPVPDGWSYRLIGTTYCFRDQGGDRVLSVDFGRKPTGNPVTACRTEAARLVKLGALPQYHQIELKPEELVPKAAAWEYTYVPPSGVKIHVRTRWIASNGKAYAISYATPESDWPTERAKMDFVLSTFYTDPAR